MPFNPSTSQLSNGLAVRAFTDGKVGLLLNSDAVERRFQITSRTAIAKNGSWNYTLTDDWCLLAIYPLFPSNVNTASLKLELFAADGTRFFSTTNASVSAAIGYWSFSNVLYIPRGCKLTLTSSDQVDRLTLVGEEIFIEQSLI